MNSQGRPISYETATEVVYGMDYNVYKKEFQLPATDEQLALFESTKANHAVHEELPPPPEPLAAAALPLRHPQEMMEETGLLLLQ